MVSRRSKLRRRTDTVDGAEHRGIRNSATDEHKINPPLSYVPLNRHAKCLQPAANI